MGLLLETVRWGEANPDTHLQWTSTRWRRLLWKRRRRGGMQHTLLCRQWQPLHVPDGVCCPKSREVCKLWRDWPLLR